MRQTQRAFSGQSDTNNSCPRSFRFGYPRPRFLGECYELIEKGKVAEIYNNLFSVGLPMFYMCFRFARKYSAQHRPENTEVKYARSC